MKIQEIFTVSCPSEHSINFGFLRIFNYFKKHDQRTPKFNANSENAIKKSFQLHREILDSITENSRLRKRPFFPQKNSYATPIDRFPYKTYTNAKNFTHK